MWWWIAVLAGLVSLYVLLRVPAMKISELEARLQDLRIKHGDIEVRVAKLHKPSIVGFPDKVAYYRTEPMLISTAENETFVVLGVVE